jgi:hypothetical protein
MNYWPKSLFEQLKIYGIECSLVGLQTPVFLDKYARSKHEVNTK